MPFLELFDETLDINSTENYEMSVQISSDGLAFALLDTIRNKYVLLRSTEPDDNKYLAADRISELISKDDFLTRKYKKVNVVMPSPKFTIVPAPLFDPGKKEEYFSFNLNRDDNDTVVCKQDTRSGFLYCLFNTRIPLRDTFKFLAGHLSFSSHKAPAEPALT